MENFERIVSRHEVRETKCPYFKPPDLSVGSITYDLRLTTYDLPLKRLDGHLLQKPVFAT
jgi:hypothetical protein